ncbi:MAG TPA: hypothetical protein PK200_11640 [Spirochaetota bacterium]|mgnify:FL=1|nr:hypothetical protein [Spirochaetota bacterium]
MISVKKGVSFSAYHNYRYGGHVSSEFAAGSRGDGFFLFAGQVSYPRTSPDIHGSIYDSSGCRAADIAHNVVRIINPEYRVVEEGESVHIVSAKGDILFGWNTVQYRNALRTELRGVVYDENGEPVYFL